MTASIRIVFSVPTDSSSGDLVSARCSDYRLLIKPTHPGLAFESAWSTKQTGTLRAVFRQSPESTF